MDGIAARHAGYLLLSKGTDTAFIALFSFVPLRFHCTSFRIYYTCAYTRACVRARTSVCVRSIPVCVFAARAAIGHLRGKAGGRAADLTEGKDPGVEGVLYTKWVL